jgi:phosphoribosylformylglycinamidine synthase I
MKAGVITFPGSNCDEDLSYVLEKLCGMNVTRLWHKEAIPLDDYDLVALPGGFSYGDYLRCGAIASLSPIMQEVKNAAARGTLVLGICNGFQILCEAGLLPGALAKNETLSFVCRDVKLKVSTVSSPWSNAYTANQAVTFPIAHGDGRYVVSENEFKSMKEKDQIVLTYDGVNPNGSSFDIAGVCNENKNVFGLMPHPERATDLRSGDGKKLWQSILSTHRGNTP